MPPFDFAPLTRGRAAHRRGAPLRPKTGAAVAAGAGGSIAAANGVLLTRNGLTRKRGCPRPWFTHQIYAPGFYTGYGVKTLPAVRGRSRSATSPRRPREIEVAATIRPTPPGSKAAAALEKFLRRQEEHRE